MLQYMHYEKVQESFEGIGETVETGETGETGEDITENKEPVPELSLVNKFLYIIGLYISFIIFFLIFGTIIFKYTMMTRLCKFGEDYITCLPRNLTNRDEIANSNKYFLCDSFLYPNLNETNETSSESETENKTVTMGIPIHFSPNLYSLAFLYKNVWDKEYPLNPGIEFPYIKDPKNEKKMMETANTMFQNIWFPTLTYVFTCTNRCFSWLNSDVIIITSIVLLILSFIGISTNIKNNNFSWKNGISLLYPFALFLALIYFLPISIYYWSLNIFYEYHSDGTKTVYKWYEVFSDNELLNNFLHWFFLVIIFWVWVVIVISWAVIASFSFVFICIIISCLFITCIFSDESYYTWKTDNKEEDRKLNFKNAFLLFIFYCKTNIFVQFLVFITLGLIASGIDSTIGMIFLLTILVLFFYYFFSLFHKIKNMLIFTHLFKYEDGNFENVEIKDLPKSETNMSENKTNGEMKEMTNNPLTKNDVAITNSDKTKSNSANENKSEINDINEIESNINNGKVNQATSGLNDLISELKNEIKNKE